jgi:membrane-bound transcription factor site-1 protease
MYNTFSAMIAHQFSFSFSTFTSLSLSFLFLFISISLFHFKPFIFSSQTPTLTLNSSQSNSTPPIRNNYIVRFLQYKPAEDHRAYLEIRIRSGGWEWIERNNPASKYPTDFGLVSIQESERERLIGEIRKLELVKDVNADLSYRRRDLLAKKRRNKGRAKIGAFVDGKKRPGKIFTAMSFSEAEGEPISNSSVRLGRQLFMQVVFFGSRCYSLVSGKIVEKGKK